MGLEAGVGVYFWGFLIVYGVVTYALSPSAATPASFFRGTGEQGRAASQWMLTASIFISWIFAKSVTNAANLGAAYGIVGGLAYATYWLSIPLAGWGFAHDALHANGAEIRLQDLFSQSEADVFASSHTCLPTLREIDTRGGRWAMINNGAAGMPSFSDTRFGVATRISLSPAPASLRLHGTSIRGVHVDAIRIDYNHERFLRQFLATWPPGSDAHRSYFERIVNGPAFSARQAVG